MSKVDEFGETQDKIIEFRANAETTGRKPDTGRGPDLLPVTVTTVSSSQPLLEASVSNPPNQTSTAGSAGSAGSADSADSADSAGVKAIADLVNAAEDLDFTAPPAVLLVQPSSTKPFDLWECCIDIANESPESPRSHYAFRLKETPENKYLFEEPGRIRQIIGSMEPKAAKYIFQMESSPPMSHIDGVASYGQISQRHYQGFIKFNKKVRAKRLITQLKLRYSGLNNALEFVGVLDEGLFVRYSKKKDGRLDGPWAYPPEAF